MASILRHAWNTTGRLLAQCHKCSVPHQSHGTLSAGVQQGLANRLSLVPLSQTASINQHSAKSIYTFQKNHYSSVTSSLLSGVQNKSSILSSTLLKVPGTPVITQTCGMKLKGVLKKRCEHCRITKRKGNHYVLCKENPRHRQKLIRTTKWVLPGVWANKWY